jgi:hypothetical protein
MEEKIFKILNEQPDGFICPNQSGLYEEDPHALFAAINRLVEKGILRKRNCEGLTFEYNGEDMKTKIKNNGVFQDKVELTGLTEERYKMLKSSPDNNTDEVIIELIRTFGVDGVNNGYDIFVCIGSSEVLIDNALVVEQIDELDFFGDDFAACRQAEKDGINFINNVDGLEKGCYVDTPENRKHCIEMLEKHPKYRIENWMKTNDEYYHKYIEVFGV